jgi:hypothetical protein
MAWPDAGLLTLYSQLSGISMEFVELNRTTKLEFAWVTFLWNSTCGCFSDSYSVTREMFY